MWPYSWPRAAPRTSHARSQSGQKKDLSPKCVATTIARSLPQCGQMERVTLERSGAHGGFGCSRSINSASTISSDTESYRGGDLRVKVVSYGPGKYLDGRTEDPATVRMCRDACERRKITDRLPEYTLTHSPRVASNRSAAGIPRGIHM